MELSSIVETDQIDRQVIDIRPYNQTSWLGRNFRLLRTPFCIDLKHYVPSKQDIGVGLAIVVGVPFTVLALGAGLSFSDHEEVSSVGNSMLKIAVFTITAEVVSATCLLGTKLCCDYVNNFFNPIEDRESEEYGSL